MASFNFSDNNERASGDQNVKSQSQMENFSDITCMDSTLYRAAAEGDIDPFKGNDQLLNLHQLLTPNGNTVLHIHITASKTDEETKFVEEVLKICPQLLLHANAKGETPLHLAARYGHARIVELLIQRAKADHEDLESSHEAAKQMLRMTNRENDMALHEAVRFQHLQVVRILTKEDPHFSYSANEASETPLYMAAERGYYDLLLEILENCSSPATTGPSSRTVLHAASIARSEEMTREVLNKFANLAKEADAIGWIPLHYAAELNCVEVVKLLLEHDKSTAYIKNKDGKTALHIAASCGYHKVMEAIISLCPDCCELVDNRGWNVLHFAVESDCRAAVKLILNNYSLSNLINEKDFDGNTPFLHISTSLKCGFFYSQFVNHPRLDKMAFNKQNQNALDIVSTHTKVDTLKDVFEARLSRGGIRPNLRISQVDSSAKDAAMKEKDEYEKATVSFIERCVQAELVGAALIATATFAAGFTLPGGYVSNEGPLQGAAILRESTAFQAFIVTDTIAMVLSTAAIFTNFFLLSCKDKSRMLSLSYTSFKLTALAMAAMIIAFITGTYAVLAHSLALATAICVIGLSFFIFFIRSYRKTFSDPSNK